MKSQSKEKNKFLPDPITNYELHFYKFLHIKVEIAAVIIDNVLIKVKYLHLLSIF